MSIEFFTRLPLHGETQYLPGDPRNLTLSLTLNL